jgi:hypothetical protein
MPACMHVCMDFSNAICNKPLDKTRIKIATKEENFIIIIIIILNHELELMVLVLALFFGLLYLYCN